MGSCLLVLAKPVNSTFCLTFRMTRRICLFESFLLDMLDKASPLGCSFPFLIEDAHDGVSGLGWSCCKIN